MQLIYIVHRIADTLGHGNNVKAVFLDISKALIAFGKRDY